MTTLPPPSGGGVLPPTAPPLRMQNEATEISRVTGSDIYFYFAQSHLIGQGGSAWVFRGYHKVPEKKAAVKYITYKDEANVRKNALELRVWKEIANSEAGSGAGAANIISFYECASESNILYVAMEKADCTLENEMLHKVSNVKCCKDRLQIIGYMRNIAAGLECLHNHKIVHRDIKPQNIFIVHDESTGQRIAKVGDFGLSQVLSTKEGSMLFGQGTKTWMAPEALKAIDQEERFLNTTAIDIFSFALVASYCLRGRGHPFEKNDKLVFNIKTDKVAPMPLDTPEHATADNLLLWMMQKDPERRPTIRQCRTHPFLWEEETCLEFFADIVECLQNQSKEYLEGCAVVRASLDATYKSYYEGRYQGETFDWRKKMDSRLLESELINCTDYDGTSIMSFLKFVTDKLPDTDSLKKCGLAKDLFSEDGTDAFSRLKYARYFQEMYPELVIVLFCTLTVASPLFPCLEKLQKKYFEKFIGCQENWTDEIIVKCIETFKRNSDAKM